VQRLDDFTQIVIQRRGDGRGGEVQL
jgi:hypothetical protein